MGRGGGYRVITPEGGVGVIREDQGVVLHPLMGGLPPEMGWQSLRLFADEVLPRVRASS